MNLSLTAVSEYKFFEVIHHLSLSVSETIDNPTSHLRKVTALEQQYCQSEIVYPKNMENQTELLFNKIKEELKTQTMDITEAVTRNVTESVNEYLLALMEENKDLKNEINILKNKIKFIEDDKRKNNLIIFGIKEEQESESTIENVTNLLNNKSTISVTSLEINAAYRLGSKNNKTRPVLVSFTTSWKRNQVLKNKNKLPPGIYIKEDYSKEVLERRRQLLPQLKEERAKGKICYLRGDKLIVKDQEQDHNKDKRKRGLNNSPNTSPNQATVTAPTKVTKTNIFDVARARTASLTRPSTSKN